MADKDDHVSLLVLPSLSRPVQRSSLFTAYRRTFEFLLRQDVPEDPQAIRRLDIAVYLAPSYGHLPDTPRSSLFADFQDLLKEVYTLVCVSAGNAKIELDFPGGLDARVFFVHPSSSEASPEVVGKQWSSGPVVDLYAFAAAQRKYQKVYGVEGVVGDEALKSVLTVLQGKSSKHFDVQCCPCGPAVTDSNNNNNSNDSFADMSGYKHNSVAVGGTFDHLHIGHKLLLIATAFIPQPDSSDGARTSRKITVGITGDELLVNKKHASLVESWEDRQQNTASFIESVLVFHPDISAIRQAKYINEPGPNGKIVQVSYGQDLVINYTQISDPFGPTITDEDISALIISAETRAGGKAVNDKRAEKGWKELEVFEVDVLDTAAAAESGAGSKQQQTFEGKISSTEIRRRLESKIASSGGRAEHL